MPGDSRRRFLQLTGMASAALALPSRAEAIRDMSGHDDSPSTVTLFLCGDVMLGRGIDQILPHPGDPQLHEPYVRSAITYVELAESAYGPVLRPVDYAYVWGDALDALRRLAPAVRIINLETSVTKSEDFLPKGINYKMSPANARVLTVADIDCCVLANNHVLDWGYSGLLETLETLERLGIRTAGAGRDAASAAAPAVFQLGGGARVLVFGFGAVSSGIPPAWAAERDEPGVDLLQDLSETTIEAIVARVQAIRRPGDILIASVHWGGNWGYVVPQEQTAFARGLIDQAGFDLVHGHSSHHPKAIEIYKGRPILYGCGDFLNDYEGITGYEEFRDDLAVMYLPAFAATGTLLDFPLEVFQVRKFRLQQASVEDTRWLQAVLDSEGRRFGTRVESADANRLMVRW